MVAFLYILNVFCSASQSTLSKQYAKSGGQSLPFNINKVAIGTLLFLAIGLINGFSLHMQTILFGAAYGVFLCISMYSGFKALSAGPMALTSIIASFSLIIPFLFGILFWHEDLTLFKFAGIVLLMLAILLINTKKEQGFSAKWFLYAIITLIVNGISSVIQKMHQTRFPGLYQTEFTFWALLCGCIILTFTQAANSKTKLKFSLLGILAGLANCSTNYIVLYLSAKENASVLFPIVSIMNIVAVWIIGIVFFKEKLKPLQLIGLLIGVFSVLLLKI